MPEAASSSQGWQPKMCQLQGLGVTVTSSPEQFHSWILGTVPGSRAENQAKLSGKSMSYSKAF